MSFTFPPVAAVDPLTGKLAKNTAVNAYALDDDDFDTPLTVVVDGIETLDIPVGPLGSTVYFDADPPYVKVRSGDVPAIPIMSMQAIPRVVILEEADPLPDPATLPESAMVVRLDPIG